MSGKFGILTASSGFWHLANGKLTRNNLKQNLTFHLVGHRWDYTVKCLMLPNIGHYVPCGIFFVGIVNDKIVYIKVKKYV